jgi:S-ribosylhomocysteine lyase LuxS involved in autoinducer biosynthesis
MSENGEEKIDNLAAAMDKVVSSLEMTVSNVVGEDGPATKQIIVRASDVDHERWKQAAHTVGKSMSQFIRDVVNGAVSEIIDCTHPMNKRRSYPWAEFCLKCNTRLRG